MTRAVAGALVGFGLALAAPGPALAAPAAAQTASALAQMTAQATAQAAENANAAFDTLVTPEALRALRRLTDSTRAALEAKDARAKSSARTPPPNGSRIAAPQTAAAEKPQPRPAPQSAGTKAPQPAVAIADIAVARGAARSELRVVAAGAAQPVLSEPFRTAHGTRLYLSFADATLDDVAPPTLDTLDRVFAGVNAAQRDDGVRIAIDATDLDRYGLETAGDTTVLWLTAAARAAAAPVGPASPPTAAAPDDLRLAGESARAGWNAFRADVARAAAGIGGLATRAGRAVAAVATGAGRGIAGAVTAAGSWFGANIPVGGIARTITFIALLLAPTAGVLLLMRSRRPAAPTQPAAAPRTPPGPIVAADVEVTPITRRTTRDAAPAGDAASARARAAAAAPMLTYAPGRAQTAAGSDRRGTPAQPGSSAPATAAARSRAAAPANASRTAAPANATRGGAPLHAHVAASSAPLTRAQRRAQKAIEKAEARAARLAAKIAAKAEREAAKAAAKAEREAAQSGTPATPGKPRVTRTTGDARLWAAKTLAASGADAAAIAQQTGISREAAGLLVRTSRSTQQTA